MRALFLALLALLPSLPAQVTVRATARTDLVVRADAPPTPPDVQRIRQGTDVTGGYSLAARVTGGASGGLTARAGSDLTIAHGTATSVIELRESATGGFDWFGRASASFGSHELEVVWRSPVATPATLRIECCAGATPTIAGVSGRLAIGGVTRFTANPSTSPYTCAFGQFPQQLAVPVVVDPAGLQLVFASDGWGFGDLRGGSGTAACNWRITLTPDPNFPCTVTSYGASCGATLTSTGDLRFPGMHRVTLEDPSQPPFAWIAVGIQRAATPMLGCTLLTDNRIVGPWPIDPSGTAALLFVPPAVPGLVLTAQGLTLGAAFHASNGLEFRCR